MKCKYNILAARPNGDIQQCSDCKGYIVTYNNLVINFTKEHYLQFKASVTECYEFNSRTAKHIHRREIFFNTKVDGVRLLFSTVEVGELLSLMKEAALNEQLPKTLVNLKLN